MRVSESEPACQKITSARDYFVYSCQPRHPTTMATAMHIKREKTALIAAFKDMKRPDLQALCKVQTQLLKLTSSSLLLNLSSTTDT